MRQAASVVIGTWYGIIAWLALAWGIYEIPRLSGAQGHLIFNLHFTWIFAVTWLVSVLIGCVLAAESSREHPVRSAFLTGLVLAIPAYSLAFVGLFNRAASLPIALTPLVGLIAGQLVKEQHADNTHLREQALKLVRSEPFAIEGIGWKSWLWLWVPMYWWLYFTPAILYYSWLNLALDWHRAFVPSLWFDWSWDSQAGTADGLMCAAVFSLTIGAYFALDSLSASETPRSAGTMLKRFLGWGLGLALVATLTFLFFAANITDHLITVSTQQRPWWQFF
jgi:hypothetical protein